MGTAALVGLPIRAGQKLLDRLDEAGLIIPVAFWHWSEAHQAWRLVLTAPDVDVKGSLFYIQRILQLLNQTSDDERDDLTADDISVPGFQTNVVKDMRRYHNWFLSYGAKGIIPLQNARAAYEQKEPFIYRLA